MYFLNGLCLKSPIGLVSFYDFEIPDSILYQLMGRLVLRDLLGCECNIFLIDAFFLSSYFLCSVNLC